MEGKAHRRSDGLREGGKLMETLATLGIIAFGIVVAVGLSYASMQAVVSLMPSTSRGEQE
jgi:hypothetical protein